MKGERDRILRLELPFSADEIWNTVKALPADRVPGPDGFTALFYQRCWSVVKEDVAAAVDQVFRLDGSTLHLLNMALITLLPKKDRAVELKDHRPISLIHSFAKLLSKMLANRLAPRLPELISINQSAFVKGRRIQDNFFLVQQTTKILHRKKIPSLLLKLDISRAFDSVSWPFLLEVLQHCGFGPRFREVIAALLRTSCSRVVINGSPGETFFHARGLRQGDPISPMLFLGVMGVLNAVITRCDQLNLFRQWPLIGIKHRISLFADDVALFLQPYAQDFKTIKAALDLFASASVL